LDVSFQTCKVLNIHEGSYLLVNELRFLRRYFLENLPYSLGSSAECSKGKGAKVGGTSTRPA
jgi:hypothetical protein